MTEQWRKVPNWPTYSVSNYGRVVGPRGVVLKPDTIKGGYQRVSLCATPRVWRPTIHRLVLAAFRGEAPESAPFARHLDGNSGNNRLSNLQWGTKSDNEADKVRHGTSNRGVGNGRAKLTLDDVREVRRRLTHGETQIAVARAMGIPAVTVNHIHTGRSWGHIA